MASKKKAASKTAEKKTAVKPQSLKTNEQHPEPGREAVPTYRADMGEGLPDQSPSLNPNRAK